MAEIKEVKCPHCLYKYTPSAFRCSNPLQTLCPICKQWFYVDTEGHSSKEPWDDCFGTEGRFKLEDGCPPEVIGPTIINTKGIAKLKFEE
jgi:hypothetical protein